MKVEEDSFADLTDYVDTVVYIPLESGELIGNIDRVIWADNKYFILDNQRDRVWIYDEAGNYIGKLSNKGRASNEYLQASEILLLPESNDIAIVDDLNSRVLVYDTGGQLKNIIATDLMFTGVDFITDTTLVYTMAPFQNLDTPIENKGVAVQNIHDGDSFKTAYTYRPVQCGYCGGNELISGDNRILFLPTYADSLYVVNADGSLQGEYCIDIPGSAWRANMDSPVFLNLLNEDNKLFPWIYETGDILFANTDYGKTKDPNRRMTVILYDRKERKTAVCHYQDPAKERDLNKFFGFDITGVRDDMFICSICPTFILDDDILEKVERGEMTITNPHLKAALEGLSEDSNPILTLVRFKI